jgi:RNA recognition motif-containing protein
VSTTLYVNNLPISTNEETLAVSFGRFGVVKSVKINRDPRTGRSERNGFVEMQTATDAQTAVNGLNLANFEGRLIAVYRAIARAPLRT